MATRLDGARAKVQRAKELFDDLLVKHREFMNLNPYGIVIEHDPSGQRVWRARVSRPIPDRWSILVGDIVHNLRAALDYLAWELWIANGGKVDDSAAIGISFPIADPTKTSTAKYQQFARKSRETTFGTRPAELIERLQTFAGRKASADPLLWPLFLLHRLDIGDKHRSLNIVGATIQMAHMTIGGPGENVHIEEMVIGAGDVRTVPIADGAELMRLKLGTTTPDVQMEQRFVHYVAFEQAGPGRGEPVIETLDQLISFVDETLTIFATLLR